MNKLDQELFILYNPEEKKLLKNCNKEDTDTELDRISTYRFKKRAENDLKVLLLPHNQKWFKKIHNIDITKYKVAKIDLSINIKEVYE